MKTRKTSKSDASTGCSTSESYVCGATSYTIACNCGSPTPVTGTCTCTSFGGMGGSGSSPFPYLGCPGCTLTDFDALATKCGFPF